MQTFKLKKKKMFDYGILTHLGKDSFLLGGSWLIEEQCLSYTKYLKPVTFATLQRRFTVHALKHVIHTITIS